MSDLSCYESNIPGLWVVNLDVRGDARGWFKESYQKAKFKDLGLPELNIVQNNISFNETVGVTRGLHAEPWNKYISMAYGKVFGAWVDIRAGESFGKVFTIEITPEVGIFVPKGVANGFQTLTPNAVYSYLVDAHWSEEAKSQYSFVQVFDPSLGIEWPIRATEAILSDADKTHPLLKDVKPMES
jgi:dTDP-4-dehydrorhamnose 3,5-epimerase